MTDYTNTEREINQLDMADHTNTERDQLDTADHTNTES